MLSFAFKKANTVILCPIYSAGEKLKLGFNYLNFAKEIIKNSKVKLFLVDDKNQLAKFLEKNMYGKKSMGIIRSTFLIDKDGILLKKWTNVKAKGHAEKVKEVLLNS